MTPEEWKNVKRVLEAVLELPPATRPAYIERACAGQPELRAEVESLLAANSDTQNFLDGSAMDYAPATLAAPPEEALIGKRLGIYQIVQKIGEGGMGVVYQGFRDDGLFRKLVAVKVLKQGLNPTTLKRFQMERQILGYFEHPYIARLLDGGTTNGGQPYYVMDFVAGQPIDEYCDAGQLGVRDRLKLFAKVCRAVQYAHEHFVVHRDLKPRNVLVTMDGEPKLLDFGIAKILGDDGARTMKGMVVMTPEYASPEQERGEQVTAASDVYALGLMLYELLSGRHPFSLVEDKQRPASQGTIPAPSRAVAKADLRRREFEGDLDILVMCALERDPLRRYRSAGDFADDIERFLLGQPLQSCPGASVSRSRRAVQRQRRVIVAVSTGLALALATLAGTAWHIHQDSAEREAQEAQALEANAVIARLLAGDAQAVAQARQYLDRLTATAARTPAMRNTLAAEFEALAAAQERAGDRQAAAASRAKVASLRQ